MDDNEAPSLSEQGVRTLKEHSSPTTRIPPELARDDEDGDATLCRFCSIEPTPIGNSLFQWFGGVHGSSWVSNCVMVVKDKLATEAIDYESLTADENGHRTIDVKIEVKDIKGLTSAPAIVKINILDQNEPPNFLIDDVYIDVEGADSITSNFLLEDWWQSWPSSGFITSNLISSTAALYDYSYKVSEDATISWINPEAGPRSCAFEVSRVTTTGLAEMSRKEAHYFEPGDAITLTNCANLLHNGNFFITAISDASSSSKCRADWCSTFHSVRQMFKFGTGVFIGSFDSSEKCLEACENAIGATGCITMT